MKRSMAFAGRARPVWQLALPALLIAGCGGERAVEPLEPVRFTLGEGLALQMALPAGAQADLPRERAHRFLLDPNNRIPRVIEIASLGPTAASETTNFERRIVWPGGRAIEYSVSTGPGGSGGPSYDLDGRISLPGATLSVRCHTQDEFGGARSAEWCLEYLETLERATDPADGDQ